MENKAMIFNAEDGLKLVSYGGDSYEFISSNVGGYLELLPTSAFGDDIDAWINEEGKFMELMPSAVLTYNGKIYDHVMGNIVFTSHDEEGETISLNDQQISKIRKIISESDYLIDFAHGLMLLDLNY